MKTAWSAEVAGKLQRRGFTLAEPLAENAEKLATVLTKMEDPFPLFKSLSTEEVAWIAAFSSDYAESRLFARAYCEYRGMDPGLFRKAEYGASARTSRFDDSYGSLVAMHYSLLSNTSNDSPARIRPFISANALEGFDHSRLGSYSVRWMMVKDNKPSGYPEEVMNLAGSDRERLELYMDAQLGFVITYKGVENALCSLWPEKADTLMIHQLQGVRKKKFRGPLYVGRLHSRGLADVDFRKAMVEFVSSLAKEAGFSSVGILGARNNTWINTDDDGRPHITMERASEIYDGTAQRLGFSFSRNGNWYRALS